MGSFGKRSKRGLLLLKKCTFIHNKHLAYVNKRKWLEIHGKHQAKLIECQIDFILTSKRYKNCVKKFKSRPGADCSSDHNPVAMTMKFSLKQIKRKNTRSMGILISLKAYQSERTMRN